MDLIKSKKLIPGYCGYQGVCEYKYTRYNTPPNDVCKALWDLRNDDRK